jgi:hypothetical protein
LRQATLQGGLNGSDSWWRQIGHSDKKEA